MFTVFSKPACPGCLQAKNLLTSKMHKYKEIILDVGQDKLPGVDYISIKELEVLLPGIKTLPQIYSGGAHIGGYKQLQEHFNVKPLL